MNEDEPEEEPVESQEELRVRMGHAFKWEALMRRWTRKRKVWFSLD